MEELETIQKNYENGFTQRNPKKELIEYTLTGEFNKLYETNLKYKLIQWRHFEQEKEIIDNLARANMNKQQYLNIIENHISSMINKCRANLNSELKDIENTVSKKEKDKKRLEWGDIRERIIEESVLKRLNTMPEDIVRVVGEFLFNPNIRYILITNKYVPDLFLFKKVLMPKLKKISRAVSLGIQAIGQKIASNKYIMNSIPVGSIERNNINFIQCCRSHLRETMGKPEKKAEINNFVRRCEDAVALIQKLGYPNTTTKCIAMLNKIYHLMILASKPENNRR